MYKSVLSLLIILAFYLSMISILIIEQDTATHQTLKKALAYQPGYKLVGIFPNMESLKVATWVKTPDVVLLSTQLPAWKNAAFSAQIKQRFSNAEIVILDVSQPALKAEVEQLHIRTSLKNLTEIHH